MVSRFGKEVAGEIAFLARELKTPVIAATFTTLGDQARAEGWSHEEYLTAVLGRQVASRTANGTRLRIAAAHFPQVKTIEDFVFDHVPAATRDVIAHLATTTFVPKRDNVVLLGPPGTGKTHLDRSRFGGGWDMFRGFLILEGTDDGIDTEGVHGGVQSVSGRVRVE